MRTRQRRIFHRALPFGRKSPGRVLRFRQRQRIVPPLLRHLPGNTSFQLHAEVPATRSPSQSWTGLTLTTMAFLIRWNSDLVHGGLNWVRGALTPRIGSDFKVSFRLRLATCNWSLDGAL